MVLPGADQLVIATWQWVQTTASMAHSDIT
jgi:hypothetical protein